MEEILSEGTKYEIYCKAKLNTLHNFLTKNTVSQGLQPKQKFQDNVRLPKLEIKRFNGDGKLWQSFIDSFQAAVDRSTSLSNVEKFNYLQGYLEGDALKCISGLSLTEGNYTEALKVLKNRYGNPKTIISAHMSSLVKIAPVISDDIISLRRLYDEIESHVRSLFTLGIDIKTHGCMLSTVILEKLPLDIKLIISRNILNNRPITYYYEDELESCLTPNNLLFGRILNQTNHNMTDFSYTPTNIQSSKLQNLLTHFWERWRREYLTTLREHHLYNKDNRNRPIIKINDVVLIEEDKLPRASWQIARVEQLIEGSDGNVRGATLKNPKSGQILKLPVNKLYKIESFDFNVNKLIEKDNVDNMENVYNFKNKDNENVQNKSTSSRPQREAAIRGELRRKFNSDE